MSAWRLRCRSLCISALGSSAEVSNCRPEHFVDVVRSKERRVQCKNCNYVFYENPKVVAGVVATYRASAASEPLYLLARRDISPRKGFWNTPGGYLEMRETVSEGAAREALEETNAHVSCGRLLSVFNILHIGQVLMYFEGTLEDPSICAASETSEARLFKWQEIPWDQLAFPANAWALVSHKKNEEREALRQKLLGSLSHPDAGDLQRFLQMQEPPYDIPRMDGHPNTYNVWYTPDGGFFYDDSWLRVPELQQHIVPA